MDDKKEKIDVEMEEVDAEFVSEQFGDDEFISDGAVLMGGTEDETPQEKGIKRAEIGRVFLKIASSVAWALIALLLGAAELPFGAIPFGIALLCAASSKLAYIYAGLCLSTVFVEEGALVYFCAYTVTLLIRALSRVIIDNPFENTEADDKDVPSTLGEFIPLLFSEHIWLRMASSAIGAFIIGIYTLAVGGFMYYDLLGTVIGMVAAPVTVYLYCGLSGNGGAIGVDKSVLGAYVSDMRKFAAICTLLSSLVLSARDIYIFGVSLSLFGAMLITLYFCRRDGIMYGLVAGTVAGLAYSPLLAPMFAFAAISSGALFGVSTFFACLSACTVGVAWGLYSEGISALTTILPGALSACLIFAVVEKLYLSELFAKRKTSEAAVDIATPQKKAERCEVLGEENLSAIILGDTEQRIKVMCETFSSLSSLFYSLSEKMRTPAATDIRQICDNAFDSFCHSCEMRSMCWESEYTSSLSSVSKMCSSLTQNGHVTPSDVSARMLERCSDMPDIINQINRNCTTHTQQLIIGDKTEIFALDYEAISDLLAAAMTSQKEEFEYRADLSERARQLIEEKGFGIKGVFVYGNERKRNICVSFNNEGELYKSHKAAKNSFEELFGEKLDVSIGEDRSTLLLSSSRRFCVEYAKRSVKAEGEEGFCGDTVSIFENGRDNFYSFISDGMGSGREAALTSGICSVFLSKILLARGRCDISLEMLNGFLRNKGSGSMHECSATVDLLEYDLVTGKADFYKGGAAPSYIYRDGNLFKLRSNTVPLGIIKELDTKKISIDTAEGDIIVMVSDGVTQSKEECPWLFDLLKANADKESLASISDMIVKRAKYEGADDDISVVVMKIKAA